MGFEIFARLTNMPTLKVLYPNTKGALVLG